MLSDEYVRDHPQTRRVKRAVLSTARVLERGHIKLGDPVARQIEGKLVVENFKALCVSDLVKKLPAGSRVFCRAANRSPDNQILSCCEIYYPLDDCLWRSRYSVLAVLWVVIPSIAAFLLVNV